jgi:hypothetical protein
MHVCTSLLRVRASVCVCVCVCERESVFLAIIIFGKKNLGNLGQVTMLLE